MPYNPEDDEILWESAEPIQHKPKAVLKAAIKRYKKGPPKLLLIEDGEGFGGKRYGSTFLKRVDLQDIEYVLELIADGKKHLKAINEAIEKEEKDNAKSNGSVGESGSSDTSSS